MVKEYGFSDKISFEGEYLNDKRHGKGKEYYYKGNIRFEGEFLNGIKWNGKGYNINNEIEYEIKNGTGLVKEYYMSYIKETNNDQLIFEGEYLNGKKHGKVKEYYWDGKLKFEGNIIME